MLMENNLDLMFQICFKGCVIFEFKIYKIQHRKNTINEHRHDQDEYKNERGTEKSLLEIVLLRNPLRAKQFTVVSVALNQF